MQADRVTDTRDDSAAARPILPEQRQGAMAVYDVAEEHAEEHVHLPPQSMWPVTTAFGVALGGLGLMTTTVLSLIGILIMIWGIASWVQELRHERH